MFRIHIELTQEGLEAVDSIIQSIFEYVEMLKTNGVQVSVETY